MENRVLLYRVKGDDRDACVYVDVPLHRDINGDVIVCGNCFSSRIKEEYGEVETFLTEEEFEELKKADKDKSCKDDDAFDGLLTSERQREFAEVIRADELEIVMEEYDFDEYDIEELVSKAEDKGRLIDRSMVLNIYKDAEELGAYYVEEVDNVFKGREYMCSYFDYEGYGNEIADNDFGDYVRLSDGRIVELS